MKYKIITDTNEYIITESENAIIIETSNTLKDFLLDLDSTEQPRMENDDK